MSLLFRLFRYNETKVHELSYLFWECTTRCNLHCRHCGSDCFSVSVDRDMPAEDFLKALDTIPRKERPREFTVVLTGGEPLLRPDIEEIGKAIRKRGISWGMVSNGYFYDWEMHSKLMGAGMGSLTISLDGLEKEHNWMRGNPGSFNRAVRAIGIAAADKMINFDVVSCINRRNISQLQDMYELLSGLGVRQWRIFTIIPIGRAKNDPDMRLTEEEFISLMEFIKGKRENGANGMTVTYSCQDYLGPYENKVRQTPFFCRAGINIASVLIDGRICACPNIDRDVFSQGNIYSDNLYEIWKSKFVPFRNRNWALRGQCKNCKAFKDCLGNGMHNWHDDCGNVISCRFHHLPLF